MHSRILQKKMYPSPYEYMVTCQRLIERYPTLQDKIGNGIVLLLQCFAIINNLAVPLTEGESAEYESNILLLSEEYVKEKPSLGKIKRLMKATFCGRRCWITTDTPGVQNVLEVFPPLQKSERLQRELTLILKLNKDHVFNAKWEEWKIKILEYSKLEAPRRSSAVAAIYNEYCALSDVNEDYKGIVAVKLLKSLLVTTKQHILHEYQDSVDLPAEVATIATVAPSIAITRSDSGNYQFFVITEKHILCESESLATDMIAAYFTFNMSYPDSLYPLLLFIQHHILDIKDEQSVPNIVNIIYSAMDN